MPAMVAGRWREDTPGVRRPESWKVVERGPPGRYAGAVACGGCRPSTPRRGPGGPTVRPVRLRSAIALAALSLLTGPAPAQPSGFKTLAIGDPAPDFNLPGVDGRTYALKDFADARVLMVVFTCNHCPTANAYVDRLRKLQADYKDKGVALVAISPNDPLAVRLDELGYTDVGDSFEDMKVRAKEKPFPFPYLYDGETQKTSLAYGVLATPHVFVFDRDRKLRYNGRVD